MANNTFARHNCCPKIFVLYCMPNVNVIKYICCIGIFETNAFTKLV